MNGRHRARLVPSPATRTVSASRHHRIRAAGPPCRNLMAHPGALCTDAGQHYARFLCICRRRILDAPGPAALSQAAPNIAPQL
jgi:hypothetical protein